MNPDEEARIYQRIGEFVVTFQWLENKLREIGWFILDPDRKVWPPTELRKLRTEKLIDKVHSLFHEAIPKCKLDDHLEKDYRDSFTLCRDTLHELRQDRNRILHSAFIELKAGGEVQGILRSNPQLMLNDATGEQDFDQEFLRPESFDIEMKRMAEAALFLNRAYSQLIQRYPNGGA